MAVSRGGFNHVGMITQFSGLFNCGFPQEPGYRSGNKPLPGEKRRYMLSPGCAISALPRANPAPPLFASPTQLAGQPLGTGTIAFISSDVIGKRQSWRNTNAASASTMAK
jgi:hypothetical protein